MKKKIYLLLMFVFATIALYAQVDSTATEPGGFAGFYDKYKEAIFIALAASGAIAWLYSRLTALRNAVDLLLAAGDDESPDGRTVTLAEWQGIVAAFKAAFWKGETKKVKDLKKPNQL